MPHFASRSGAVALTSAALMGLSGLALPAVATAADATCAPEDATYSVTGGTIEWGYHQPFRTYFFNQFAKGKITPSEGVQFVGEPAGADGRIVWPVTDGSVESATSAVASGEGSANFSAHGGALNTTFANPTVEINGTEGVLKLDYTGKAEDGTDVTQPQAAAANFTVPSAPDFQTAGSMTITADATLDEQFVPVFGRYDAGTEVDPVTVKLNITSSCEDAGEPGDGGDDNDDGGNGGDNGGGGDNGTLPGDDDDNTGGGFFGSLGSLGKLFDFLPF